MSISLEQCRGCRDDFYNQPGNALNGKRCWHAEKGEVVTRYAIGTWTMPGEKGAFTEVEVPSCYNRDGTHYYKSLPDFVKADDVIRSKREVPR